MIFTVDILSICSSPAPPLGTFPAIAPCSNSGTPLQFGTVHRDCACDSGSEVGASTLVLLTKCLNYRGYGSLTRLYGLLPGLRRSYR